MENYEIIKKYLEHGFWACVQFRDTGHYRIYNNIIPIGITHSDTKQNKDDCMSTLGIGIHNTNDLKDRNIDMIITPMYPPFKPYEVGDLVDVLETVKNMYGFESRREKEKEIVGRKGLKIDSLTNFGCYEINFNGYDFNLPHHVLAPHIPTTPPDTITIGGQEYSKQEVEDRLKDLKPVK